MEFKYNLRNLRREKGVTSQEVGEYIGVTRQTVSEWERGKIAPSRKNLEKLAQYFSVTMDYLIGREGATVHDFFSDSEIIDAQNGAIVLKEYAKLSKEDQGHLLEYLEFLTNKQNKRS